MTVGNCIPTDSRYAQVARAASVLAGLPIESVAMTVNRLCRSGPQTVVSRALSVMLGDFDYAIGGDVEVMSCGAYLSPAMRFGARMGNSSMVDGMVVTLTDPFGAEHTGTTGETAAEEWNIGREK